MKPEVHLKAARRLSEFWQPLFTGSYRSRIFGATATIGAAIVFAKVAAMLKETVVAWRFGTSNELDAFYVALLVPFSVINIVGSSLQTAFIPTYIRVHEQEGTEAAETLFSGLLLWAGAILLLIVVLLISLAPFYLPHLAAGFSREKLDLTFRLLCLTAPLVLLSSFVALWSAALNAHGNFALASITPIVTTLITILLLVTVQSSGVLVLPFSLLAGTSLELLLLHSGLRKTGFRFRSFSNLPIQHLNKILWDFCPLALGSLLLSAGVLIQLALVARLSSGSVSAWNYANKLITLPIGLTATALSTAIIPFFSRMAAQRDFNQLNATVKYYLKVTMIVTVPLTALLMFFSTDVTRLAFQRGALVSADVAQISSIFLFLALQVPFYVAGALMARLLLSLHANWLVISVSGISLVVNALLSYLLMQKMGVRGTALATSLMYLTSFLLLGTLAYRKLQREQAREGYHATLQVE